MIAMQKIKALLHDDDSAVSPVIGVILMVAITVILAAVIASFVLGLGDETDDVSPNIVFDADFDQDDNSTTITVDTSDGDVDVNDIEVRGAAVAEEDLTWGDMNTNLGAGESVTLQFDTDPAEDGFVADPAGTEDNWDAVEGEDIVIVFETDDTSDTLDTITVPDA